jgi:hypothetical protein
MSRKQGGRMPSRLSFERWHRVWQLLDRGWTVRAIARAEPCHHRTVQHYIKKGRPPASARRSTGGLPPGNTAIRPPLADADGGLPAVYRRSNGGLPANVILLLDRGSHQGRT